MHRDPIENFSHHLQQLGFTESANAKLTPLTGGVSSEIYLVEEGARRFVIKRALEKLKVEADWYADISRNDSEQAFIRYVAKFRPDAMPEIYRSDAVAGLFSMEFLDGFRNWKEDLLAGTLEPSLCRVAGELLGEIHAHSWDPPTVACPLVSSSKVANAPAPKGHPHSESSLREHFDKLKNFDELRIDPYLRATAAKHPELAPQILAEATRLTKSQECLIHGDFSPKNILHKGDRLVALDCEVACYADAAFDLSFFLNHLCLKALYHSAKADVFAQMLDAARVGYRKQNPTYADAVEAKAAVLLPMLMLARVDGKSPVEYLNATQQAKIRSFASERILKSDHHLEHILSAWLKAIR